MKHHFADHLDREGDYWTIVPNIDRYTYAANDEITNKQAVKIFTIGKYHEHWKQVFDFPNLEELTLHEPNKEQAEAVERLPQLKRLRVTFFRTDNIEFIGKLSNLEELVLEYVSGFSDITPLRELSKIKSLHLENLRRVCNFDGLRGLTSLRYLNIDGTLDWNQPIENFGFLEELPNLEVFSLGFVINKNEYPALLPMLKLKKLKKLSIGRATFPTKEYAFLETAFPNVTRMGWDLCWEFGDCYEFLGKRAGKISRKNPKAAAKCDEFKKLYEQMKKEADTLIKSYCG